jgi:hypothetical protein
MKVVLWIVIAAVVVGLGIFAYLKFASAPAQTPATAPTTESVTPGLPSKITEPVPASSYGRGAIGDEKKTEVKPSEITPSEVGVIQGTAKPASGAQPNFTLIKVSISDPQTKKVLATTNLDTARTYKFTVAPGEYVLDIVPGTGSSNQLPQRIYVGAGEVLNVNFFVK